MSNAKLSLAAIFGAVGATATATTTAVNTLASVVDMGAAYVREAAINQRIEQAIDREEFIDKLVSDRAIEKLKRDSEIATMCADPSIRQQFDAAREHYAEIAARYSSAA